MTVEFTTTELVAAIKRRGFIPVGSGLEFADFLAYATDELDTTIPAFLKGLREEFLVTTLDLPAAGGAIEIPERACGAALRTIGILKPDGKVHYLPRYEPENVGGMFGQTGEACGYIFEGNTCVLLPAPTSGTVRVGYQLRPGKLVGVDECARVTALGATPNDPLTVTPAQDSWDDSTPLDIVSATGNFPVLQMDATATGAATTAPAIDGGYPAGLQPGDYLCEAGTTCIPQIPREVHVLLAQATALAIANAIGSQRLSAIQKKYDDVKADLAKLLSPRSDGSARVVVSRSRIGRWGLGW